MSAGAPTAAQVAHLPVGAGDGVPLLLALGEGVRLIGGRLYSGLDGEEDDVAAAFPAVAEPVAFARVAHHMETHGIGEGGHAARSVLRWPYKANFCSSVISGPRHMPLR